MIRAPCPGHGCLDIGATGSPDFAAPDTAGVGPGENWHMVTWWKNMEKPGEKHGLTKVNSIEFLNLWRFKSGQAYIESYWIYWSKIWNLLESFLGVIALIIPHFRLLALSPNKITQTPVVDHQVPCPDRQQKQPTSAGRLMYASSGMPNSHGRYMPFGMLGLWISACESI